MSVLIETFLINDTRREQVEGESGKGEERFPVWKESGLRRLRCSNLLKRWFRIPKQKQIVLGLLKKFEGGQFYSSTLREILVNDFGVAVGAYSYGDCCIPGRLPAGVTVGRYVSMASDISIFVRNHPLQRLSMHPFFYNSKLGFVENDTIASGQLWIGHDSWVGHGAVITPKCHRIGIGAVIAANAVVTKDVPDFAIVAGNPGRIIRYRFSKTVQQRILDSKWWNRTVDDLSQNLTSMLEDLNEQEIRHPLLSESVCK